MQNITCFTSNLFLEVHPSLTHMKYKLVCYIIWGNDSSVVNNSFGEPGHIPLYVGLLSAWVSVDGYYMFSLHFVGGLLFEDSDRYK